MKAIIFLLVAGLTGTTALQAQTSVTKAAVFSNAAKEKAGPAGAGTKVNLKVQRAFERNFGTQATQNWSAVGRGFLNKFYVDGVPTHALYAPGGYLVYTIAYGTEKQMPAEIKSLVNCHYPGYTTNTVTEVKEDGRHIWVVQLQTDETVVTARIENNELEEVQRFKQSK